MKNETITVGQLRALLYALPDDAEVFVKDRDGRYRLADWAESQKDQTGRLALAVGAKGWR